MQDPLYQALGTTPASRPARRPRHGLQAGLLACAVAAAGVAGVLVDRQRRPPASDVAVAPIEVAPKPPAPAVVAAAPPPAGPAASRMDGGEVEIQHGVKVIRLAPATSTASVAIPVPGAVAAALKPAPDPRLVETTRLGALPRIGPDGTRPAAAYARPAPPETGAPRIALVVAGMGLNQSETARLGRRLPGAVTFAFPPDAPDLAAQVAEARAAGHEVVLQLPAPAEVPPEGSPLDRLHRLMSRVAGYAGVSLAPGDPEGRQAVLRELGQRGLYGLDTAPVDAAAPRGDLRGVDALLPPDADRTALDRLTALAKARGSAVGWIAGPGLDADALAGLAGGGVDLVPLSALADTGGAAPRAGK